MADLPYRVEYAKSNRSSCKGCREKIEKDHLRLAVMVQSPMFDGKVPNWYHYSCFFGKQRPKSVGDFSHFESIRWEDQEKLKTKIESGGTVSDVTDSSAKNAKKTTKRKQTKGDTASKDFRVEYAVSSRAVCRGCEEKIIKNEVRASKKDYESEDARRYGGIDLWHHLDCFAKLRADLEFWASGAQLNGFKTLTKEDQIKVKELLPEMKPVKKEEEEEPEKKPKLEDDSVIKKQNKLIYKYRDALKDLPKNMLTLLLEYNGQQIPSGIDKILDRLADAMAFGALLPCKDCRDGQLTFRSGVGYFCLGNKDDWVKCEKVYEEPKRKPFRVPEEILETYPFFKTYKYKPQKRVFQNNTPSVAVSSTSFASTAKSTKSEPDAGPKISRSVPLKNMEFTVVGKLKSSKEDIKLEIMKLGGKFSGKIHENTVAVISTPGALEKMGALMERAKELNVQVVPESFIDECKSGGDPIANIVKMNLASWGSDPSSRISADVVDYKSKSRSSRFIKSDAPTKVKLKVKDGVAVDPDSGLEDVAHVYRDGNDIYTAALSLTDLQSGKNSFYKIQILQSTDGKRYWLFRSWGRIGTTIGSTKLDNNLTKDVAIQMFKSHFEDKTANMWDNRSNFRKVPGKMIMMDICYEDEGATQAVESEVKSKLEKPVQDLVSLIFNVSTMKNVMMELELDTEKMPLGKLSKKQIQEALKVLTKLQNCIVDVKGELDTKQIISYTNQFFTLIPHDFGVDNPPLLTDLEVIKQKVDMLDTLFEIEIAYSMVRETAGTKGSLIDAHYMKLNTEITVLDKASPEFKTLELYVKNTHAETHRNYELEIVEVFKVQRNGEQKRFKPFKKLNRKLLWHGSRLTNFAGILSQGLRIAPPEAPVTGYMFGKGIYFADMVSKSANYCVTSPANNTGILMLCEVAVGESHELLQATNITKLPKGKHSVKGIGKTHPDPTASVITDDGVEIPLGKCVPSEVKNTSLLYNEFIVYDVAQVKVQYLLQMKFNYTCF